MSPRGPRIVAELGRPETPEETAARKAESSRAYRSSQTFRHLIAALLATLAVVAIVIFMVPRGDVVGVSRVDVATEAAAMATAYQRTVIAPAAPAGWLVNSAKMEGDDVSAWTVVYVPDEEAGYLRFAQAFDPDPAWVSRTLSGASSNGSVTIAGIEWTRYEISDAARAGNVSYALATDAGTDEVLLYGTADADTTAVLAAAVADQIRAMRGGDR
ncbi:DUF4245 family protein [Microbacterium sp. SORGH_AS_0888]|uniref:DUF4245 family protein n=1 Tax=Microbacterium sp. SORGH_AS_0888 TaxID=3041791 RepID=UPI00277EC907|nr:DUF4245 family protein [Microbacterium sp. SORGH_AS_0888]MDQ1128126.1 hypothetical protein [Microbacterium sp. SORGH_AS_0888]